MTQNDRALLTGADLKKTLEKALGNANHKIDLISAYITQPAIDWLDECIKDKPLDVRLICRLHPSDIVSNATNLSALQFALNKGWEIACLRCLHAKIYSIDSNKIYIGSANLTSNGLNIYGHGNLETCVEVDATVENVAFINDIINASIAISAETLQQMEAYINQFSSAESIAHWPESILAETSNLWVKDMFWCNLSQDNITDYDKAHDTDILQIAVFSSEDAIFKKNVEHSRPVQWLINRLQEQESKELYFGTISQLLHNELQDDPAPYRKDVKSLVQNLLAYCQICLPEIFEVTRPNHSQRITLLMAR